MKPQPTTMMLYSFATAIERYTVPYEVDAELDDDAAAAGPL